MANQYVNKVEYGGQTLIDLTQDTVTANDVAEGVYFHLPSGQRTVGTGSGGDPNGDNLGYGDANYPFMILGTGLIGTGRVI